MVKVIQAGFSRTATLSFSSALRILADENGEGEVYHGENMFVNREVFLVWDAIYSGKRKFDENAAYQLLGKDDSVYAVTDAPFCMYLKELLKAYPNAKVVLLHHPGGWEGLLNSKHTFRLCFVGVCQQLNSLFFRPITILLYLMGAWSAVRDEVPWKNFLRFVNDFSEADLKNSFFGTTIDPANLALNSVEDILVRVKEIRELVPKDKLLEYSVTDGWDPLCKFLGVPVPNASIPKRDAHNSSTIYILYLGIRIGALISIIIILADIYVVVRVVLGYTYWKWPVLILTCAILALLKFKQVVTLEAV